MNKDSSSKQNRFGRIVGSRPVQVAGVLAAAYLAGGLFAVPALLKWQLPAQAQSRLGATLTLGKVYFNPFTLALEMRDISLRTQHEGALLSAERLRIDLELSSLVHRAWTFSEILLDQPMLRIALDKQGRLNFQSILDALAKPEDQQQSAPPRLLVQRLALKNGVLDYVDQRLEQPLISHLSPVSLEMADLGTLPSRTGSWQFSARSEADEILKGGGSLGLQPLALSGKLELNALKVETLARALHRQLALAKPAGSFALQSEVQLGMAGGALSGEFRQAELAISGISLSSPGAAAPFIKLDSARLALPQVQLIQGSSGLRLIAAGPALTLGAASAASGAARMQAPGMRLTGKELSLESGSQKPLTLALQEGSLELPRLQLRQADGNADISAPALQLGRLELAQAEDGMRLQADAPALSIKGMSGQVAGGSLDLGASSIAARQLAAGRKGSAPFMLKAQGARLALAGAALNDRKQKPNDRGRDALYSLASGNLEAGTLDVALPASGPDVSATGLAAGLQKLVINDPRQPGELARIGSASMRGAAFNLGARRMDLGTLTLADGAASLRIDKDGGNNWSALAGAPAAQKSPAADAANAAAAADVNAAAASDPSATPQPANTSAAAPWRITAQEVGLKNFGAALADARQTPAAALALDHIDASLRTIDTAGNAPAQLKLQARSGTGSLSASGAVSLADGAADLALKADALPLQPVQPYLAGIGRLVLNSGSLSADGRLRFAGKQQGPMLTYAGSAALNGVTIDETAPRQRFLAWDAVAASDMKLSLSPNRLDIGQLRIVGPVGELLIAEDGSVNLSRVLHKDKAAKEGAPATRQDAAPTGQANAQPDAQAADADPFPVAISRLRVERGLMTFADFSQQPQFSTRMHELRGVMTGLSTRPGSRARLQFEARVAEYGDARIEGSMNPFKPAYATDVRMDFRNVDLSSLSPYVVRFAGYQVESGSLSMDLRYQVKESRLVGDNRFVLNKVQLGKKVESPTALDLPLELALALLRDQNGVISIGVPVSGDLQNPEFSFGAVARRALGNVFRNIVSAPFRALASLFGGSGEQLDTIGFDPGSAELAPPERQKLDRLATGLAKRPAVRLLIHPAVRADEDMAALRSLEVRRQLLAAMGVALEPGEAPGPVDTGDPKAQRAIESMYAARFPGTPLRRPKEAEDAAWHEDLLKRLIDAQPLAQDALARLQHQRGDAVRAALLKAGPVQAAQVALEQPEQAGDLKDGEVQTRLELAAVK